MDPNSIIEESENKLESCETPIVEENSEQNNSSIDKRKFFNNIFVVLISNFFSVLSGVLIGFLVPKMMGVSEYGYYKSFTLYCSYIGVFHFGFVDGIYLKYAGKKYNELDKEKFRTYTRFLMLLELSISAIGLLTSFLFLNSSYRLILIFVSINVLATILTSYFEFISQIVMNFKRSSARIIIRSILNILSVVILYILYKKSNFIVKNTHYVAITLCLNYIMCIWYLISYRDIVFGQGKSIKDEADNIKFIFKVGFPLLISNLISQFIFIVDQQFVNIFFENDTYSVYAFAYNMINLVTIATNAISIVLYPTLKTLNKDTIKSNYSRINSYLLMFVSFCLCAYFPLDFIVNHFLPKYIGALIIFKIVLPGVLISSSISVIKYNCYKTFGKINSYFIKSLIILVVAIIADIIAYICFRNTVSISIVSIAVLFVWYVIIEYYFIKKYNVKWILNLSYIVLILLGFYLIMLIPNIYLGLAAYFIYYLLVTFVIYHNEIGSLLGKFKRKKITVN